MLKSQRAGSQQSILISSDKLSEELKRRIAQGQTSTDFSFRVRLERPVGVDLLEAISIDLYKNPFHVIRELVQNSYDEGASDLSLIISQNRITLLDDGRGMAPIQLSEMRRVFESPKLFQPQLYPDRPVGRWKIGIYAGYRLADEMVVRSKVRDDDLVSILRFNFKAMRFLREKQLIVSEPERLGFPELVEQCTEITGELCEPDERHRSWTEITLGGLQISPEHVTQLHDVEHVKEYLMTNFCLDYEPTFKYRDDIVRFLRRKGLPHFRPIKIDLIVDNSGSIAVRRPNVEGLDDPRFIPLKINKKTVAIMWLCTKPDGPVDEPFRGLTCLIGPICVWDRQRLREDFAGHWAIQLYRRLTGEIHIIDPAISADLERADLVPAEMAASLRELICRQLSHELSNLREKQANKAAKKRTEDALSKAQKLIDETKQSSLQSRDQWLKRFEKLIEAKNMVEKTEEQGDEEAQAEARELLTTIRDELAQPVPKVTGAETRPTRALSSQRSVMEGAEESLERVVRQAVGRLDGKCQVVIRTIEDVLRPLFGATKYSEFLDRLRAQLDSN